MRPPEPPSSVVGPDHGVELPFSDRRVDHEIELAFLIGDDVDDLVASLREKLGEIQSFG